MSTYWPCCPCCLDADFTDEGDCGFNGTADRHTDPCDECVGLIQAPITMDSA